MQNDETSTETAETEEVVETETQVVEEDETKLPEWARKKLEKANKEAAKYRTELRSAQEVLSKAKTPEDVAAATTALTQKVADLEKSLMVEQVAGKFKLPAELKDRLRGATEAELEADAAILAKLIVAVPAKPAPPKSLKGGLNPGDKNDADLDPRKLAQVSKRR